MTTIDPTSMSASGGHDDDDNAATRAGSMPPRPEQNSPTAQPRPEQSSPTAQPRPEQPLYEPLPYGTGFSSPQPLGFGVGPVELGVAAAGSTGSAVEVADRKRSGSPVLAVAGLLSMAVAVWAILGGPVITPTVLLAGGLVLTVLVGLIMVVRR